MWCLWTFLNDVTITTYRTHIETRFIHNKKFIITAGLNTHGISNDQSFLICLSTTNISNLTSIWSLRFKTCTFFCFSTLESITRLNIVFYYLCSYALSTILTFSLVTHTQEYICFSTCRACYKPILSKLSIFIKCNVLWCIFILINDNFRIWCIFRNSDFKISAHCIFIYWYTILIYLKINYIYRETIFRNYAILR